MVSNVQALMYRKGISVEELADRLNVSRSQISKARNHIEFCNMMFLMEIANALGCKVKDLFEEEE